MFAKVCVVLDEYEEVLVFVAKCVIICEGLWRERVGGMMGYFQLKFVD